jgi:putative oxidoreductase
MMTKTQSIGILILRIVFGGAMLTHGLPKLLEFNEKSQVFPDPLGVGSVVSLLLTVFAEFFCAVLVILGLGTRFAALTLAITMAVAAFVIHGEDPFGKKELALLYFGAYVALIVMGGGRIALDAVIKWKRR